MRRAVSSTLTWSAATACSNADWSRLNSGAAAPGVRGPAVVVAVLLARRLLQLGEALEPERLAEAHDGRGRGARAPRELLRGVERDFVEMIDHVLRDVLLRARELVEARGDVRGERLVAAGGRGHRGSPRHGETIFRRPLPNLLPVMRTACHADSTDSILLAPARARRRARASSWRPSAPISARRTESRTEFVQDNHSRSRQGTLRGIHFQTHPGQGKLVRVARGRVFDVVVDLRRGSQTFGQWEGVELDDEGAADAVHPGRLRARVPGTRATSPTSSTSARATTTRRPRPGSASTIRQVGIEWPAGRAPLFRARRDRAAAPGARGHAPVHRVSRDGRFAPSPTGACTSATCAPRCSRGCSRAPAGARS